MTPASWLKDSLERALVTFVVAIVSLLTVEGLSDFNIGSFGKTAGTAGLVALASFLKTLAWPKAGLGLTPVQDVAARAVFSAVQAGAIVIAADAGFQWYNTTAWQAVGVAVVAALASAIKGAAAERLLPNTVTPASLAKVGPAPEGA